MSTKNGLDLDDAALAAILERLPASTTVRGFVFNAVLGFVAEKAGAEQAEAIRAALSRRKPNDLLSYPAKDYFTLLRDASAAVAPAVGPEAALRELGKASALGFFVSPMGKLLLKIIGGGTPARLMANEPTAYATSFSFGKRKYEKTGERSLALTHREDYLPVPYNIGALEGALLAAKLEARIEADPLGQDAARYTLTW